MLKKMGHFICCCYVLIRKTVVGVEVIQSNQRIHTLYFEVLLFTLTSPPPKHTCERCLYACCFVLQLSQRICNQNINLTKKECSP